MEKIIKPPFVWFGGKSRVAHIVWKYLGDVEHYIEPFFGSGAVLFGRPTEARTETVNDKDHLVANFWRAVQHDPQAVAEYADNPINEDDLSARHIWIVKYGIPSLSTRIVADPEYYDAKIAGWWVWGINAWIGSGWCAGNGPWSEENGEIVNIRPSNDPGVKRQLPHLGNAGQGVNRQRQDLVEYMQSIADRLRFTRVCTGDWARIVTNGALNYGREVGIFLDPPYSTEADRDMTLYREEDGDIAHDVREWCVVNGANPRYRIALCGYDGEHDALTGLGWSVYEWSASASYQAASGNGRNADNRKRERIWFSPACLRQNAAQNVLLPGM